MTIPATTTLKGVRLDDFVKNINGFLLKWAKEIQKILKNKPRYSDEVFYLDEDERIKQTSLAEIKNLKTLDILYFRFYFENGDEKYRLDLFERNMDCGTGNIHVIPGIIRVCKKVNEPPRRGSTQLEYVRTLQSGSRRPFSETGWEICKNFECGKFFNEDLNRQIMKLKPLLRNFCEDNASIISPNASMEHGSENSVNYFLNWLYHRNESEDNIMTLCYSNIKINEDANIFTFYSRWQTYPAKPGKKECFHINTYRNGRWEFLYPKSN